MEQTIAAAQAKDIVAAGSFKILGFDPREGRGIPRLPRVQPDRLALARKRGRYFAIREILFPMVSAGERAVTGMEAYSWNRRNNTIKTLDQLGVFALVGLEWLL